MKKFLSLSLAILMALSLVACDKEDPGTEDPGTEEPGTEEPGTEEPAVEPITSEDYIGSYPGHYETLNWLVSQSASDNDVFANLVDGLVENDNFGRIVPSLATEWSDEVTDDNKHVWTFKIREGVMWQEYDGTEYAEVKAQDWVDAAQFILNPTNGSETISLWFMFVDGAENYYCSMAQMQAEAAGEDLPACTEEEGYVYDTDFSNVGVTAIDDYTLQYTLAKPAPYFITALTYSAFLPVNGDYLADMGLSFGFDGESILYNGAYYLTEDVENSIIVMERNPDYWDADHVYINKVTWIYIPDDAGSDWARIKYENGELNSFRVTQEDTIGWEKYVSGECYGSECEGSLLNPVDVRAYTNEAVGMYSYYMLWNWGRENFDGSEKTEDEIAATTLALQNADFRLGFLHGINRATFLARYNPDNPLQWSRNTYTKRELVNDQFGNDYVDYIGKVYAEANGLTEEEGIKALEDGRDPNFDVEKALAHFEAAKTALLAAGLTEADFPIKVETITTDNPSAHPYYKATLDEFNEAFGEIVTFVDLQPASGDEWSEWSNIKMSYDLRWMMGWGPDYADPITYLNTYVVGGDMIAYSGLGDSNLDLQETLLGDYTAMVEEADEIWKLEETDQRFMKFAEAEHYLLYEQALILPFLSVSGKNVYVSNTLPKSRMDAPYGLSSSKYKHWIILDEPVTREERDTIEAEWQAEKDAQ